MSYTLRPTPDEYAAHHGHYVALVPEGDIVDLLRRQESQTAERIRALPASKADWAYAPGKWTIKEVLGHMADTERVMSYRALRFAREDPTPLAFFDENAWVPAGRFGERTLQSLLDEFLAVRAATIALFDGLPADAWSRRGTFSGATATVRAIACVICGHELHHLAVLEERYGLPAIAAGH
jgi:hypothetical protein